jgi:dihydropteroate synthase
MMPLRLRDLEIAPRPGRPALMGIVNTSPESFSDGGALPDPRAQVAHALRLAREGATLIDVGGESGATDCPPVSPAEEIARVVPVVERLARAGLAVSIDTWKAPVAYAALSAGAVMVNDPSGLTDPDLARVCADYHAGLVVTHAGAPPKVNAFPHYTDVVADVVAFVEARVRAAERAGVARERVVVDPGLDLGKTPAQSIELVHRLGELHSLELPILVAASRKDFVGALTRRPPSTRLGGTLAAVGEAVEAGANLLRVHDVAAVSDFLAVGAAIRGEAAVDPGLHLEEDLRRERRSAASRAA